MLKNLKKRTEGFTIIEVLIVLAIAGLIMVIVFLAVPALQRNSRNTQYRTEATNILGAYQELANNNGGDPLTTYGVSTTSTNDSAKILTAANTKQIATLDLQKKPAAATTVVAKESPVAGTATDIGVSKSVIYTEAKCTSATSGVIAAGTKRQVALYFAVEVAGSNTPILQCIDA